jgi:hypothetical protein
MAGGTEPEEQNTPGSRRYARPGERVDAGCTTAIPCLAMTLTGRVAASLLVPGLDWPLWAAVLVGVLAAALIVLLPKVSWLDGDKIAARLFLGILYVGVNVAFVAFAGGIIARMGVPIWLALPLGATAIALLYLLMEVGPGYTQGQTMMTCCILAVMMGLMIPVLKVTRQKARMALEQQRHRSTLRIPSPPALRGNGDAATPGRNLQPTGTVEPGPASPDAPHTAGR